VCGANRVCRFNTACVGLMECVLTLIARLLWIVERVCARDKRVVRVVGILLIVGVVNSLFTGLSRDVRVLGIAAY
jgi:hypothetical protein